VAHQPRRAVDAPGIGDGIEDRLGVARVREVLLVRARDVEEEPAISFIAVVQGVDHVPAQLAAAEPAERAGVDPRRGERQLVAVVDRERLDGGFSLDAEIERGAVVLRIPEVSSNAETSVLLLMR